MGFFELKTAATAFWASLNQGTFKVKTALAAFWPLYLVTLQVSERVTIGQTRSLQSLSIRKHFASKIASFISKQFASNYLLQNKQIAL